jgi:hypothetical protein
MRPLPGKHLRPGSPAAYAHPGVIEGRLSRGRVLAAAVILAFGKIDFLMAGLTVALAFEFIGKNLYLRTAGLTFTKKRLQVLESLKPRAMDLRIIIHIAGLLLRFELVCDGILPGILLLSGTAVFFISMGWMRQSQDLDREIPHCGDRSRMPRRR